MNVDQAAEHFIKDVEQFKEHYKKRLVETDHYVEELELADWYEQFESYISLED